MLSNIFKIFDPNQRELRRYYKKVEKINLLEKDIKKYTDLELRKKTDEFRNRLQSGETLENILPEAYACVREASCRTIGLRHFDVQLIGGMVLHEGRIAEMKTGEGKTLVATLPLYLNALEGKGCHLVTVNDYLAKRDALWMGPIYLFLGLSVGVIQHGVHPISYKVEKHDNEYVLVECSRKEAYLCDITYGTNNEFGFDYLRDNMAMSLEEISQRELNYAIIDEVDSILIDEARTPLIISGQADKPTDLYYKFARIIPRLKEKEDYLVDERANTATLTESGISKIEQALGISNLSDPENIELFHHANCALRAHTLMKKDVDYVVKDGKIIIVDEFTGRLMYGRRYSEGLHQAIEAKEGVKIERESQTLATITFQNYFRLYKKLAGMTGTAKTEEQEFRKIYNLDVVVIPTHKPMIRKDFPDVVYKTEEAKFKAIVDEIVACHKRGQPVLVGTRSIEKSEMLSRMLHSRGIVRVDWKKYKDGVIPDDLRDCHFVLNAKEHEHEAKIIKNAGRKGAVTIATNMAGRGVDIILEDGVAELGGLHVIGTERHESRRIDNQLRGRSGRQGDPGSSRFYVALDDELMRLFGGERVKKLMERFGFDDTTPIEHPWITKSIENAQKKVEMHHFSARKYVLEYDDVMEVQRSLIYKERRKILEGADLKKNILSYLEKIISNMVDGFPWNENKDVDIASLKNIYRQIIPVQSDDLKLQDLKDKTPDEIKKYLLDVAINIYNAREKDIGENVVREIERYAMLRCIDEHWIAHLDAMDYLKEGIHLRAYAQVDPLVAYRKEAHQMFSSLLESIQEDVVKHVFRIQAVQHQASLYKPTTLSKGEEEEIIANAKHSSIAHQEKIGRNSPCTCGSGKKYKKCCGK